MQEIFFQYHNLKLIFQPKKQLKATEQTPEQTAQVMNPKKVMSERPYSSIVSESQSNGPSSILRTMSYRCASASNASRIFNRKSIPASSTNQFENNQGLYASVNNSFQHVNKTSAKRDTGMGKQGLYIYFFVCLLLHV